MTTKRISFSMAILLMGLFVSPMVRAESVIVRFQIHPKVQQEGCGKIPSVLDLKEDQEFLKVLKNGWVKLKKCSFDEKRKPYPCLQNVEVQFPRKKDFYDFLMEFDGMVQYPFYSGADYALFTKIFELVSKTGDERAYKILLLKNTSGSASELNAPLFAILREDPRVFGKVFFLLDQKQKEIAVQAQYDFNYPASKQLLKINGEMGTTERKGALEFNKMMLKTGETDKN